MVFAALLALIAWGESGAACVGRWPNPVTDICWKCLFPIKIGGVPVSGGDAEDTGDAAPATCFCPIPTPPFVRPGVGTSFWEPARVAEVVREPFCSPLLGGASMGSAGGLIHEGDNKQIADRRTAFYHVHWIVYPLTSWMSVLTDSACAIPESFDVAMLSELEPTWNDDELAILLSPEAILFATPPAQAACAADCIAASFGFPLDPLFWCGGCQGSLYPMSGNIIGNTSGLDASLLATMRMAAKLHRTFVALDTGSQAAMCMPTPLPILVKSRYKTQMIYPVSVSDAAHPFGRTTTIWGAGKEFPIKGEDFAYVIWRKRVCCAL